MPNNNPITPPNTNPSQGYSSNNTPQNQSQAGQIPLQQGVSQPNLYQQNNKPIQFQAPIQAQNPRPVQNNFVTPNPQSQSIPVNPNQSQQQFINPSNQHLGIATPISANQPVPNQLQAQARPLQPQQLQVQQAIPNSAASTPTQQQPNLRNPQTPVQRQQFVNPSNFQQTTQLRKPQSVNEVKQLAIDANILREGIKPDYSHLDQNGHVIQINTFEILKLCIYLIPGLPIAILILRSINDEDVIWNARQSLVAQAIWLIVLAIMNLVNLPLVSGNGFSLALIWNIVLYFVLTWAGVQVYLGKRFRIPLISEIGTVFIDGK